ncbi:MAG: hemerythrin [Gammaproteobacteria bacterium]|nr:hemerythrin [Gammaproteobacteria bacterium]
MEATKLLTKDHRKVQKILDDLVETSARSSAKRRELLQVLKQELQIHEKVEEKLFYPRLIEAYEEHHLVDKLLAELEKTDIKDEHWKAKITVLRENLVHHIKEEENEIFPKAHQKLGEKALNEMGEKIQAMKQKETAE